MCESDIAHGSTRKSLCVGSQTEFSPATMSNPDGTVSMRVSSGGGVAVQAVDVDVDVDVVGGRGILIGEPC